MNPVTAGFRADVHNGIARSLRSRFEDPVGARQPDAHRIHENVAVVRGVEVYLAADRRHTHAVAVTADTGDDARHEVPRLLVIRRAKTQGIHHRNRTCAHGEDIAHDSAHAGCCTLVWFDVRWMVVTLHLEDRGVAIAYVDHARV